MTGLTGVHKALLAVIKSPQPITKQGVMNYGRFSQSTADKQLTRLKRSGLIIEKQGRYIPADKAKEMYAADPTLNSLAFDLVNSTKPDNGKRVLNWEFLQKWSITRYILKNQENYRDTSDIRPALETFLLIYQIQNGHLYHGIDGEGEKFPEEAIEKFNTIFNLLIEVSEILNEEINDESQ